MTDVKRYDREHEDVPLEECESENGDMVLWEEHTHVCAEKDASHAAEIAQREARMEKLERLMQEKNDALCDAWNRNEALQRQVGEMQGRWIPWKPADDLPPDGKYWTTRVRDGDRHVTESEVAVDLVRGWWPVEYRSFVVAYWSIQLPPPYIDAALSATTPQGRDGG
jgi:hypothetical protein